MALINCPDCERKVSDRAKVCPDCACPIAEVVAEMRETERREHLVKTREMLGEDELVDCPKCDARGFYTYEDGAYSWCAACEHTGRLRLAKAENGYYGVATYAVERFLSGELHPESSGVVFFIGEQRPEGFRYPEASARKEVDPEDIPW